jgi:hypothetical protein
MIPPSISEFERNKPRGTHRKINSAINKYEGVVKRGKPMDDEEATRVEMAYEFIKELKSIRESFLAGE